jgi:cytochrome P450
MDRFDIHSVTFAEDPWQVYARLREGAPVCWSEAVKAFVLTKHADVLEALRSQQFIADFRSG